MLPHYQFCLFADIHIYCQRIISLSPLSLLFSFYCAWEVWSNTVSKTYLLHLSLSWIVATETIEQRMLPAEGLQAMKNILKKALTDADRRSWLKLICCDIQLTTAQVSAFICVCESVHLSGCSPDCVRFLWWHSTCQTDYGIRQSLRLSIYKITRSVRITSSFYVPWNLGPGSN